MSILALCPSRGRPGAARETLASFEATRRDPGSRLVFVVDRDDPTRDEYPADHVALVAPKGYMGAALAAAGRDPAILADATSVGMIGDDNRFGTPGWDVTLDAFLVASPAIAYGDDGFQHERLPTSWWVSRPIVDELGIVEPSLRQYWMDNVWKELGEATGILRYFPDVVIEHLHPLAGKAADDATYQRGARNGRSDKAVFERWRRIQKARDVARLRSLLDRDRPRRVLADWHHPALWESLSILFEDRFGWELYSPLGLDWTRHGWRFAMPSIGWTAADYLEHPGATPVDDHFELVEREYPERPRKLVTWAQAAAMPWDFVLASVSVHQRPFAELAKQLRARFVHQVGNANHPIDRGVPQVTLASAAVAAGRSVVTYHQEFDRGLFRYTAPTDPQRVTSFMLRLASSSCPHGWFSADERVDFAEVGGADPRDPGYLAPMTRVAERLAATGWVWHDKRIGDGYGHVLHTAAAMGRPLIGHSSHYAGRIGAPLWRDLETCLDLDRHSERDALRLWAAISADPDWYRDLTESTAAAFSSLVDFDAEAAVIRRVLA